MSVRLADLDAAIQSNTSLDLLQLERIIIQAYHLDLALDVDRQASAGCFQLTRAGTTEILRCFDSIDEVTAHLDSQSAAGDVAAELPRNPLGAVDTTTPASKHRRKALHIKTGYSSLDCVKALRAADGDIEKAYSKLIETAGYRYSKV